MTLSDADRAAHKPVLYGMTIPGSSPSPSWDICDKDGQVWPCQTVLQAALSDAQAERDAAQAQVSEADIRAIEAERREAATEADAKALAEALEGYAYLDKTLTASGGDRAVDGRVAALSARERTAR